MSFKRHLKKWLDFFGIYFKQISYMDNTQISFNLSCIPNKILGQISKMLATPKDRLSNSKEYKFRNNVYSVGFIKLDKGKNCQLLQNSCKNT